MQKIRYFDYAATTYTRKEVIKEMIPYFNIEFGNPSSIYTIGRNAKKAIDNVRQQVANAIKCKPKEIYFTSGGSESDNIAIKGIAYANKNKGNHIITSKIEHPAVLNTCKKLEKEGFIVTYLNVDSKGLINLKELQNSITPNTILISIMFANNEVGTIEPIEEIGKIAKKYNIIFHTDSVQAIGNLKIDVKKMNIDLLSMSAHKFYGPKGVGALYIKEGIMCNKLQDGGHQEKDLRAGTENVSGIVGLGKAIELAYSEFDKYNDKIKKLRDYYIKQVEEKIPYTKLNGDKINRLVGNSNISFEFINAQDLLLKLDTKGICVSAGSACSAKNTSPSHVLKAMGISDEIAKGTIRVTFGNKTTKEDVDYLVNALLENVQKLRNMNPEYLSFTRNRK